MQIAMDKAGRIVIPRSVRDRAHLRPGAPLEIPPFRIAPGVAMDALVADWREQAVVLTAAEIWVALGRLPAAGVSGGRTCDALIAACARKAGARTVLTWNTKHFEPLADGFEVVSPAGAERA